MNYEHFQMNLQNKNPLKIPPILSIKILIINSFRNPYPTSHYPFGLPRLGDLERAVGYYTWSFLHTMAAYSPAQPSPLQRSQVLSFFDAFREFYSFTYCAAHLQLQIQTTNGGLCGSFRPFFPIFTNFWEILEILQNFSGFL
jgi:hypothetical protein